MQYEFMYKARTKLVYEDNQTQVKLPKTSLMNIIKMHTHKGANSNTIKVAEILSYLELSVPFPVPVDISCTPSTVYNKPVPVNIDTVPIMHKVGFLKV